MKERRNIEDSWTTKKQEKEEKREKILSQHRKALLQREREL